VAVVGTGVVTTVDAVVVTAVVAMPRDVARRGRRNNDDVRAIASVSVVRLRLRWSAQCGQCEYGCSAECRKHLLHGSSFEELSSGVPILRPRREGRVRLQRILEAIIDVARDRGLSEIDGLVLSNNADMLKHVKRLGSSIKSFAESDFKLVSRSL
jgi:hypothetical protein